MEKEGKDENRKTDNKPIYLVSPQAGPLGWEQGREGKAGDLPDVQIDTVRKNTLYLQRSSKADV